MKLYKYEGDGITLGSTTLAIAGTKKTASEAIYSKLKAAGLARHITVKDVEEKLVADDLPKQASVIYFDNGDY